MERFVAMMADEPNIREVVGFPKVASGSDPLTGAPTPMPPATLKELGLRLAD
jgi:aspartyl-tRNA synthetase